MYYEVYNNLMLWSISISCTIFLKHTSSKNLIDFKDYIILE